MFREDQTKDVFCLLALYIVDKLLVSLLRNPVRKVLLWASVRIRGKKLLKHVALLPSAPKYGVTNVLKVASLGTTLFNSAVVMLSWVPSAIVRKSVDYSMYPQL